MSAVAKDLEAGFEILWYKIESVLGRGGFGITYLATDTNLGQLVAIKEYLPHEFATRGDDSTVQPVSKDQENTYNWGLERFMTEAQTLAKFKHPNIVRVLSVFKHNNTGYIVMEYEQGEDLSNVYKRKKKLTQRELEDIYYPIIDGLASVHKEGFIHRDIKPANIYIRNDGSPVLIDFGAARQAVGSKTKTLTSMLSIGYAPFEQYNDEPGKQGPWTDIYALGASLHQGIRGVKPMESTIRGMALLHDEPDPYEPLSHSGMEGYSLAFLRAIDQALMLQIHDRPQTLGDFLGMLKGEIVLPDLPVAAEKVTDSSAIRNRTVVRPIYGAVDATDQPDQQAKSEIIAPTLKDAADTAEDNKLTLEYRPPGKGLSTVSKSLLAMGGIAAVIVAAVIYLPGEPSPEDIQRQKVDDLLKQADELITGSKYYDNSGNGAFGTYQQILAIEPNNSAAKKGIHNVAQHYLRQAEQFIDDKDFKQADASLKTINTIDPGFPGLKDALSSFAETLATEKIIRQVELFLGQASSALEQGQVYEPKQKSALFYYRNVIKLDPDNVTAKLGLFRIADRLIDHAQTALKKNNAKSAETLISLAESINPDKEAIKTLRQQINKTEKLKNIKTKADKAYAKNRYTTPQNDNAYELYTQVLAIAPSNLHAQGRLNKIADYYVERTRRLTQSGNIASANVNLEILKTYFPNNSSISRLKVAISRKQNQIAASKKVKKTPTIKKDTKIKKTPSISKRLLPVGVNQKQDDYQVVQDIVGLFINAFKNRDMDSLSKVSQLTSQQQGLYASIFKLYQSLNIKVVPNSFTLSKKTGVARVKFEIIDLVDSKGHAVVTSANWIKIEIKITKMDSNWQKAAII